MDKKEFKVLYAYNGTLDAKEKIPNSYVINMDKYVSEKFKSGETKKHFINYLLSNNISKKHNIIIYDK